MKTAAEATGGGPPTPQRLLLIQPRWMGDVLLCTPAVRAARQAFPSASIEFLTEPAGAAVLAGNPHLDGILVSRGGARAQWELLRQVRRRRYDVVVDFRSTGSTARAAWLSGAARRIGTRGRGPRNLAYTDLLPRSVGPVYTARQKLALLGPLGVATDEVRDLSLELTVGDADHRWAEEEWSRLGLGEAREVVAVSVVTRDPLKQWGADRWARVADALMERGATVLLTHGPGEEEQVQAVVGKMRRRPVWGHRATTPQQLAALYRRATMWLGHDGGAKHIAVAAGVPTVSVLRAGLGPVWTDASPGSPHRYVEGRGPASDPRGGLDALPVDAVLEVASEVRAALHQF